MKQIIYPILASLALSCAINNVSYRNKLYSKDCNVRVTRLGNPQGIGELVISMDHATNGIIENVLFVNWVPKSFELVDYNGDNKLDIKILDMNQETHILYQDTEGFHENTL